MGCGLETTTKDRQFGQCKRDFSKPRGHPAINSCRAAGFWKEIFSTICRLFFLYLLHWQLPSENDADERQSLTNLDRSIQHLVNDQGVSYQDFRNTLRPKWWRVWLEVCALWLMLLIVGILVGVFSHGLIWQAVLVSLCGGIVSGFLIASLQLFVHEAVHFNLHPDKRWNDLLSNLCISCMTGVDVKSYRKTHWNHHRHLGTAEDSEISYFDALRLKFFVESLFGIKILRALFRHLELQAASNTTKVEVDAKEKQEEEPEDGKLLLLTGVIFNAVLFAGLFWMAQYWVALSWALGVLVFYPFFNTLRQLLEHRDEAADGSDGQMLATLRMFGNGWFARIFGGAGFNAHLLHHWDPQVSYTNFSQLEEFLMGTSCGSIIEARQTSYWATFSVLFRPTWS